jgi:hypothetical protein
LNVDFSLRSKRDVEVMEKRALTLAAFPFPDV